RSERVLFSGNQRDANKDYADWIGIPSRRIKHIPNAIDPNSFTIPSEDEIVHARAELGLAAGTPVILGVFRLAPEKDPISFVEVCARVGREVPNLRALLVGVGPLQQRTEERIAALGLDGRLTLL